MKSQCSRALVCAFFLSGVIGIVTRAVGQETPPAPQQAGSPHMQLSAQEWNFGQMWQGPPLVFELTIKNVGDAALIISDVKPSCGCTVVTKPKSPLAPGESDVMTISYDSRKQQGAVSKTVTITTNDPVQPSFVFKIEGSVLPLFTAKPSQSLTFGALYPDSHETRSVEITNNYPEKMALKVKEGQNFAAYNVELKELEPGMRYELTATTRPPLSRGMVRAQVQLLTGFEKYPEIMIDVGASVQPLVRVSPDKLYLPRTSVSEMRYPLCVTHAPHYPVKVLSAKATPDAVKVEVRETPPANGQAQQHQYEILVVLPPGDRIPEGVQPSIVITTDAKDPAYQTIEVPIQITTPASRPATQPQGGALRPSDGTVNPPAGEHSPTASASPGKR